MAGTIIAELRAAAEQALAGDAEARDRGGDARAQGIGFDGGAPVRRQCEPGLCVAQSFDAADRITEALSGPPPARRAQIPDRRTHARLADAGCCGICASPGRIELAG